MITQIFKAKTNLFKAMLFVAAVVLTFIAFQVVLGNKVSAATITVGGACSIEDAMSSIAGDSDSGGCTSTGAYGTDDLIDIPAGTHSYPSTTTVEANATLTIQGAGMGQTIVDLGDANDGFALSNGGTLKSVTFKDMSIINPNDADDSSAAIWTQNYSTTVQRVEVYSATSSTVGKAIAISGGVNAGQENLIEDIYIHDISLEVGGIGIDVTNPAEDMSSNTLRRITIADVLMTSSLGATGIALSSNGSGGTITGTLENATFKDVDFSTQGALITASSLGFVAGTFDSTLTVRNITTRYTEALTPASCQGADISGCTIYQLVANSITNDAGATANSTIISQNNVISSNSDMAPRGCGAVSIDVGGGGTQNPTLTSQGGNITDDDTSCNSYLTATNDQTNVANLADTLGPLQDNGGTTQTIALLTGSPAIDNGITNAVTTDQRGTARPQGSAFDSGAYEFVPASVSEDSESDSSASLADTGQNTMLITIASISLVALGGYTIRRLNT